MALALRERDRGATEASPPFPAEIFERFSRDILTQEVSIMTQTFTQDLPLSEQSPDTFERREQNGRENGQQAEINVGQEERIISVAGGALLATYGLSRMSLPGLLLALVGGGLIKRGYTGHCDVYEKLGIDRARSR